MEFILGIQGRSNICQPVSAIHHSNKMKNKSLMISSIDAEKASDKIQHSFMTKVLNKVDNEGTHLNIIETVYYKPTFNIILNSEKLKAIPH